VGSVRFRKIRGLRELSQATDHTEKDRTHTDTASTAVSVWVPPVSAKSVARAHSAKPRIIRKKTEPTPLQPGPRYPCGFRPFPQNPRPARTQPSHGSCGKRQNPHRYDQHRRIRVGSARFRQIRGPRTQLTPRPTDWRT
jgi:hypothetical protein